MPLWFLRHGESETNAQGLFAGSRIDSPLTPNGLRQVREAAPLLPFPLAWIVSSPLRRALDTAITVRDALNLDVTIEVDDRVTEWDMGLASGTPIRDINVEELIAVYQAEDIGTFNQRVMRAIDDLTLREGTGLLVSHTGVARSFLIQQNALFAKDVRQVPLPENGVPFRML